LGEEVNIVFHTQYFSCVELHDVILLHFVVSQSRAKKYYQASYPPKLSARWSCVINVLSDLCCATRFQINTKNTSKNLFMGLCANTFTLVHSSFEKSMENIFLPGFSCSAPNLASAKFRNGLKIIKFQNQYLNKKVLSSS